MTNKCIPINDFKDFIAICFACLDDTKNEKYNGKKYPNHYTHSFMQHQEIAVSLLVEYGYLKKVLKNKEVYKKIKGAMV